MAISLTGKNKTVFAIGIPKCQWEKFVDDEVRKDREKPSEHSLFMATTSKSPKRTAKKPSYQVPVFAKKTKAGPLKNRFGKRPISHYECPEGYELIKKSPHAIMGNPLDDWKPSAKTKKQKAAKLGETTKRVSSKSKKRQCNMRLSKK
jgi:hypothetical protein